MSRYDDAAGGDPLQDLGGKKEPCLDPPKPRALGPYRTHIPYLPEERSGVDALLKSGTYWGRFLAALAPAGR